VPEGLRTELAAAIQLFFHALIQLLLINTTPPMTIVTPSTRAQLMGEVGTPSHP
jgi:hypothetical protein